MAMPSMYDLFQPLSVWEGAVWMLVPAVLQWFILARTRRRMQSLRLALLLPVFWVIYAIIGAYLLFVFLGFLILLFFSLIFQADLISTAVEGALSLAGYLLCDENMLYAFGRLGLFVAGWGLGWAAHSMLCCVRGNGNV